VNPAQRLISDEAFDSFDAQGEFALRQRALAADTARAQPIEVDRERVFRTVDDPKIFAPAAFHSRLNNSAATSCDELKRLDHHAFAAPFRVISPPIYGLFLAAGID
jgi:hypothetical protein